ncbi:MAG: HAMP domain-containing protein [Rhodospirillaceae bacterium]|nr:HAMP domain-containing protein [Rhodospirillales bacterium]
MRLKRRLTIAFAVLAVLPLTVAAIALTRASYDTAFSLKVAEQRQDARIIADAVQAHVNGLVRELLLTVRVKGLGKLKPEDQRRLLSELLAWQNQFADLAWLDGDGQERARVSLYQVHTAADLGSRAHLPEFQGPRASAAPWFGPIEIDTDTAEPLMAVSVPAQDSRTGMVTGVLVARLRLKHMWEIVANFNVGDPDLIYIADPSGLVVAHSNPSVALRGTRAALPDKDGINVGLAGNSVMSARMPLLAGSREFAVVAEESAVTALALPIKTAKIIIAIIAAALVAALAMAVLASRAMVNPLQRLAAIAGQIAGGDLTRRAEDNGRRDEIGELARAFNSMTTRLGDSVVTLDVIVKQRTHELSTAQARLIEAIESISEGFMLCDANDNVVLTNRKFRDFFPEIAHLVVPGKPFRDVIEEAARRGLACEVNDSPADWLEQRELLRANQIPHVQHLRSGRWLLVSERRTNSGQMVAIYTDITDLKVGEEELRSAKAQAENAAQAKSDFLAAMSHELRTPLNAVIGFSDTMLSGVFGDLGNERYRGYVEDIHHSGQHLLSLINDILDLSKIEADAMSVECQPVALNEVVQQAVSMMKDSAQANGLRLDSTLPTDLPLVAGDDRRLLQVMLNLLSNAVKFTPEGGRITIDARAEGTDVVLQVADTGIGIKPEDIPRALQAFGQIDSARSRRFPGTGLGLPLSRRLVELHGGTLSITSAPGMGTTVTVRLRAAARSPSDHDLLIA